MILFPIVATAISAIFAVLLFRQWSGRRRLAQLAWAIALTQYAAASLMVALAIADQWDGTLYRLFWLFGAMLNVPWLALGSVALISGKVARATATVVVIALSVYGLVAIMGADLNRGALAQVDGIPRGSEIWLDELVRVLARWYSIGGWLIVVGIALLSSRPHKGLLPPAERVRANVLIAVGVSIVAIGGFALTNIGQGAAFSVTLALGVTVMFAGFLLASRAPRFRVEEPGESPT